MNSLSEAAAVTHRKAGRSSRASEPVPERARCQALSDSELVRAMRRDEPFSFHEFIDRFRHVAWMHARDLGVDSAERKSWVEEALHDCALALSRPDAVPPKSIGGYVVTAVRRKRFLEWRKEAADERRDALLSDEPGYTGTRRGYDESANGIPEPVRRLADALLETLTPEQELLLCWRGERVSYTTIAEWVRLKRDTVIHRVWRLTKLLADSSEPLIESFSEEDKAIVRKFLERVRGTKYDG